MLYSPMKFTEWHFNKLIVPLFTLRRDKISGEKKYKGQENYMLISQPWEMSRFFDPNDRPKHEIKEREEIQEFLEGKGLHIDSFQRRFLPDAVLLDWAGKPYVFEVKMELREEKNCSDLVLQTLIYANVLLSPAYDGGIEFSTYECLDLLYKSHWFSQEYEGGYTDLKQKHAEYFGYKTIKKTIGEKTPGIIFALVNPRPYSLPRLIKACEIIRSPEMTFDGYKEISEEILPKNSQFRKRIDELRDNWVSLQKMELSVFILNLSVLEAAIEERFIMFEDVK